MSKSNPFRAEDRGDLRVVTVAGDLDLRTSPAFGAAVTTALAIDPPASVAVDLTACGFIDSSGITRLLYADQLARETHIRFAVIADPHTQPCRVLKLTRCTPDRLQSFPDLLSAEATLCGRPRRRLRVRRNHPVEPDFVHLSG